MTKTDDIDINKLLEESYVAPESVFDRNRTKTSHFMLNTILHKSTLINVDLFVNAFIDDHGFKHSIDRPLFLLFKTNPENSKWKTIAPRLRAKSEYVLEYFCGIQDEKDLIMMVFQVPEVFKKEYAYFKAGKYSQFSDVYKKMFNRYIANEKAQAVESAIYKVLHKTPEFRKELELYFGDPVKFSPEDELWGIPEPEYEIFRYNKTK